MAEIAVGMSVVVRGEGCSGQGTVLAIHGEPEHRKVWVVWEDERSGPLTYDERDIEPAMVDGVPHRYELPVTRGTVRRWLEHQRLEGDANLRALLVRAPDQRGLVVIKRSVLAFLLDVVDSYEMEPFPDPFFLTINEALTLPTSSLRSGLLTGHHMALYTDGRTVVAESWLKRLANGSLVSFLVWGGVPHCYTLLTSFAVAVKRTEEKWGTDWRRWDGR